MMRRWSPLVPVLLLLGLVIASLPGSVLGAADPLLLASGSTAEAAMQNSIFLPLISRVHRVLPPGALFDDFSDPSSGWPTADEEEYASSYTDGEYRFLVKQVESGGYSYHPTFRAVDCEIQVDVRFGSPNIGVYGLAFGVTEAQDAGYLFDIRFDFERGRYYWELWKAIEDLPDDPLVSGPADSIRGGQSKNTLRVERIGEDILLYANGQLLMQPIPDDELIGNFGVGLVAGAEDVPNVDVRFDNFYAAPLN
jgi:hypothetical protein